MTDQDVQQKRLVAAAIDIGILIAISGLFGVGQVGLGFATGSALLTSVVGVIGALAALGFVLLRDVLVEGRSPGKHIMGLRIVTATGTPCDLVSSVKRNAPFSVGALAGLAGAVLSLIPCFGACVAWVPWLAAGLLGLAAVVVELIKIVTHPGGVRLGDQFAGTSISR